MKKYYIVQVKLPDGIWYIDQLRTPTKANKYFKTNFWMLGDSKIMAAKWNSRKEVLETLSKYPVCRGGEMKIIAVGEL